MYFNVFAGKPKTLNMDGLTLDPIRSEPGGRITAFRYKSPRHTAAAFRTFVDLIGHLEKNSLFPLVERCRNHHCRKLFTSNIDFKFLSDICKLGGNKCEADILLQERCGRA